MDNDQQILTVLVSDGQLTQAIADEVRLNSINSGRTILRY